MKTLSISLMLLLFCGCATKRTPLLIETDIIGDKFPDIILHAAYVKPNEKTHLNPVSVPTSYPDDVSILYIDTEPSLITEDIEEFYPWGIRVYRYNPIGFLKFSESGLARLINRVGEGPLPDAYALFINGEPLGFLSIIKYGEDFSTRVVKRDPPNTFERMLEIKLIMVSVSVTANTIFSDPRGVTN